MSETIQTPVRVDFNNRLFDANNRMILKTYLFHQDADCIARMAAMCINDHARLVTENAEYAAEVERLREALLAYSRRCDWCDHVDVQHKDEHCSACEIEGHKCDGFMNHAQAALEAKR